MCCQLDPIFLFIASNADKNNTHSNKNKNNKKTSSKSTKSSPLINIVSLLFVIHYASSSKMRNLLVKVNK